MVCSVGVGTVAEYYLSEQAEYYTGGKEPAGRWYRPDDALSLVDGETVGAERFRRLHAGRHPDGRVLEALRRSPLAERVGGYDLTFSAPKSVSILWAVGGEDVRSVIEEAQEAATRAALDVLRDHASYARRGKGGAMLEKVAFFGATFQHGESRPTERPDGSVAVDPQLHTHAVVFNLAQRDDGSWGALDGRQFFKWKMAAGAIYRSHLASALQQRLGVDIEVTEGGLFEVAGVPEAARQHFSTRRQSIEQELATKGLRTKDAQAFASNVARTSRRAKSVTDDSAIDRHDRWRAEAQSVGLNEQVIVDCLERTEPTRQIPSHIDISTDVPGRITEHEAVFNLAELYRAAAEQTLRAGADSGDVEKMVADLLETGEVVEIGSDELGLPVYSTREMVGVEALLVDLSRHGARSRRHSLSRDEVLERLAGSDLTDEQRAAVECLTTGHDVAVVEGAAGAGKTHALKPVADAYKDKGYRVIGTATAWRMANQLSDELNIEAKATDAWLADARAGKPFLDIKTVLIVDEAGQLSSRQMLNVLDAADRYQAKVILTGDQKQLQAIGAGPGLRLVAEQTGVARIDTIVRQREAWARKAMEDLSIGRAGEALGAFEQHDAVTWCADDKAAVGAAVADWKTFKTDNPDKVALVMAKTNAQVRALSTEMRAHLRQQGQLSADEHVVMTADSSGRTHRTPLSVGDQIVFKRRIDELRVINGTAGVVTQIDKREGGFGLRIKVGEREITFSKDSIADANGNMPLAHGYASTVYSAQGVTVDAAYVVADHRLRRNEIYVAASRARDECRLYVDAGAVEKSVNAKMALSTRGRGTIDHDRIKQHLVESWSRAQMKTSTRDYERTEAMQMEQRPQNSTSRLSQHGPSFKLPVAAVER